MEPKEDISDTDSGIILHSGPDSPCTVLKDVSTHTRAVRVKLEALEERLEACVLELKKLCIREAELTGHLSSDYPLLPGQKPPQVRRRIGAAFKLDDPSLLDIKESALSAVEAELALQQQIVVAARRLCQEGALSKAVRRSRMQQCRTHENKLRLLQDNLFKLRLQHGRTSPLPAIRDHAVSDDSSLSDSTVLDDEERTNHASRSSLKTPPPEADTLSSSSHHLQDQHLRQTPSPTHHTHTHTHTPPQTMHLSVPSPGLTHYPVSPSPGHTLDHLNHSLSHTHHPLNSPTNHTHHPPSPSLSHTPAMTTPLHSPALSHPRAFTNPLSSPSLNHTHIKTTPIQSPSLFLSHISLSPSPSPSPSLSSSLAGDTVALVVAGDNERPPIEHSPWSESSLDQPYEKKKRSSSRKSNSPAVTPTLPPLEVCVGENRLLPLSLPLRVKPTQTCSAPCTPEMQLRRGLSLRLPSSEDGSSMDHVRGRSRVSRRRLTDLGMSPDCLPLHVGMGNPLYQSSSEDSASEHSSTSCTSSSSAHTHTRAHTHSHTTLTTPAHSAHTPDSPYSHPYGRASNDPYAHPFTDLYGRPLYDPYVSGDPYGCPSSDVYRRPSNNPYGHPSNDPYVSNNPCGRPLNDPYGPSDPYGRPFSDPYGPMSNGFYRTPQHQSTPSFSPSARAPPCGPELGRTSSARAPPCGPELVRVSRTPSLREPPLLHPRDVVSDQLRSWHQRQHQLHPRPRSLDRHRQGALRIRHTTSREPPQPVLVPRDVDRTCGSWTTEDDAHIISQL